MSVKREVDDGRDGSSPDSDDGSSFDSDDGSSPDSDDGCDNDHAITFADIPNSKTMIFPVRGTYTRWGPREAFRELVQNWRDAIIESNNLNPKDFRVTREAKGEAKGEATPPAGNTEILYKAFRRGADDHMKDCLGFIRYKGRNGAGTVELSNLRATLHPEHLDFGGTSKRGREDLAGAHGEGLKLAALVLMHSRQNHHIICRTGGFTLTFNLTDNGRLVARLRRIKDQKKVRQPKNIAFPTPAVRANGDVQFIIGELHEGRNQYGEKVKRSPVQQHNFKSWTKVALFLTKTESGNNSIISTVHGDLLTSEDLRGNLYLKDLLLRESTTYRSASITGHRLGFGYNFAFGQTNRERQSLADAYEESVSICDILSAAIRVKPDLAAEVCDLLNSAQPLYAEAQCNATFWSRDIAVLYKQNLLGGEFAGRWLYSGDEMHKNPRLGQIIEGMGREPFKLTDKLWDILVQYGLIHTAEEEGQKRYEAARAVAVPKTSFAISVNRLLRACLRACPQTSTMKVEFVDAGQIHLDLHVSTTKPLIRLHKRWLSMDAAVTELGLVGDMTESETVAYTVKRLFADVLEHLPREMFLQQDNARLPDSHMKRESHRAEQRLVKYQRMKLRIVDRTHEGHTGLSVEWAVNARRQDDSAGIEIQCHQVARCPYLRDNLLIAADAESQKMSCISQELDVKPQRQLGEVGYASDQPNLSNCRVHYTNLQQGTHCESGLKEGEKYFFVLVMPKDPNSLVVVSNTKRVAVQSKARSASLTSASPPTAARNDAFPSPNHDDGVRESSESVFEYDEAMDTPVFESPEDDSPEFDDSHEYDESPEADDDPGVDDSPESDDTPEFDDLTTPPGRSRDAAEGSGAASRASQRSAMKISRGTFSLGPRLETLEILELALARDRWYKALNSDDVQAVIGIVKGEKVLPEESRKRRRVD